MQQKAPGTETHAGGVVEQRALSTAAGGTALTTTAALVVIPDGVNELDLIPRNFVTGVVAQVGLNPYLIVLKTTDNLATVTEYSRAAQDGAAGTVVTLSSLDTLANGDFLLVGSHLPFRGVDADMTASVNANASVLTAKYRKTDDTWTDITATDGTVSAGKTFAQDGQITWTVPTDWAKKTLREIASPAPGLALPYLDEPLYWTRWEVSAALDSSVTAQAMLALNRSTAYAELPAGVTQSVGVVKGPGGVACVEAKMDAGTGNLIVNAMVRRGSASGVAL